jgi:ornithine--oxo-acid transaminase
LKDENMSENAQILGEYFRTQIRNLNSPFISLVRGKGLLNAIVIKHENKEAAWDLCMDMMKHGLLAKPTHGDKIRLAPPLVITQSELDECVKIIAKSLEILN